MKNQKGYTTELAIIWLLLLVLAVIGWVMNIVKLFGLNWDGPLSIEAIIRIIGVPIPFVGAISGYF